MDSKPIVTLEEAKEFLGVPDSATKLDLRYTMMIEAATRQIEQATGRFFTRQAFTEFLTSRDSLRVDYDLTGDMPGVAQSGLQRVATPQTIYLRGVSIAADPAPKVWYDPYPTGTDAYSDDDLLTEGVDYIVDRDNDTLLVYIGTRYRPRAFKIDYTAGYEVDATDTLSTNVPDLLKMACFIQMQFLNVKLRDSNIGMGGERTAVVGSSGKSVGVFSQFLVTSGLTPEVASMLRDYKRVATGRG